MSDSFLCRRSGNRDNGYVTINFNVPAISHSVATSLSEPIVYLAATTVGDYALFGGGHNVNGTSSTVDAYKYKFSEAIQVYPGTKYKFNDMQIENTSSTWRSINETLPLQGYIKVKSANIS